MHLLPLALLATTATAHIVLNLPTSFGFDDDKETTGPCGSFNPMNRTTVTQWPINGGAVAVLQADKSANLTFNFLMAASTSNVMIVPAMKINVAGTGDVCMPVVAPPASITSMSGMSTVGMPAVLQVVGETDDGKLYQVCAAVGPGRRGQGERRDDG